MFLCVSMVTYSGEVDSKMLSEMDQPRCGVKDAEDDETTGRNTGGYTYLGKCHSP